MLLTPVRRQMVTVKNGFCWLGAREPFLLFTILGLLSDYLHSAEWVSLILYLSAYLSGGWDAAGDAWAGLIKGELDMHFLMLSVTFLAALIGGS